MKFSKTQTNYWNNNVMVFILITIVLFISVSVKAAPITVSTIQALQSAINKAKGGDTIILANGTYRDNTLNIGKNNILIQAATSGGVFLNGTNAITISGSNVTFSGFQFITNTTMTGSPITVSGNSNTLTQLNFNGYSADHMIYITGSYNTISYSNFQNKPAILTAKAGTGDLIQIIPNGIGMNIIQYCSFQHLPGMGGDYGNECIRIGNSSNATEISRTIVEYCYFEDTGLGDSESISVKSMENVLRFNTMRNNLLTNFCFRNGDNNVAYGNFFINSGGIRVKEANNIYVYNNYFENCGDGNVSAPVKYVFDETSIKNHLNNLNFIHNTFVGGTPIQLGQLITPNNGNILVTTFTNNTWANNIFKNTKAKIFSETVKGNEFAGNIYNGSLGINVASGMTKDDPLLIINTDGYYGLSSASPAIDKSSAIDFQILDIPEIDDDYTLSFDGAGKPRPTDITLKDVGSYEFTTAATTNHPLTISEVGPFYLGEPSLFINSTSILDKNKAITIFPNPATASFSIKALSITSGLFEVAIFNLNGQLIKSDVDFNKQGNTSHNNQYDVSDLNNGVYLVKVTSNESSKTMKLIIQK